MSLCYLCPRNCGADRENGLLGYCRKPSGLSVSRASLHMWEEPCISGSCGSGTVFFSGCNLRCVYCQNHQIALNGNGANISEKELADIFLLLQKKGAHNINLVTPTHYADKIAKTLEKAKPKLTIPVVYNTSGYELPSTIKMLDGLVDIYLTDFKYALSETAEKYSNAPDYPEISKKALAEMVCQKPSLCFDNDMLKSGVIVRHLLLPGNLKNSKEAIKYVFEAYGDSVLISIMNQYTPIVHSDKYPELNCKTSNREYQKLIDFSIDLGVTKAYIQDGETSSDSYVPLFGEDSLILDF